MQVQIYNYMYPYNNLSHFNNIYIWAYNTVICHFLISIVKDNENWLLFFKNSARRGFLALGPYGKTILNPREEKSWTTLA
jgi:hypothetical protein